ncbi:AmmeMemoRadiSam system protein B [Arcobacter arenosus]|uniref:AmmeMemoRadiSam system protein B n=1 Tax=Arcobacter arenosus TaxID=2576037 RepID=A0A5R8Y4Z1_9BACT|nr:AmmeMemoRadiSam system protein B [Arcobacter arenosus]TLP40911.1 AmmeMemoRadiSam system protein B [Arcobacter arenosus]
MTQRKTVVAGSFYPNSKEEILAFIDNFNKSFKLEKPIDIKPKAVIVPHAGYVYSGFTANLAYNLSSSFSLDKNFKRAIVIGPSHRTYINGASIALYDEFETPIGNIKIDKEYSLKLKEKYNFLHFEEELHFEHSTETQAPFVKNYFDGLEIIEIVYGKLDFNELSLLIDYLLEDEDNFIIISTDLSHFYSQDEAKKLDNICLKAIIEKNLEMFEQGCEACGKIGVKAIIKSAIKKDLKTQLLHYCTSFDVTKDDKSVVGYTSALIGV